MYFKTILVLMTVVILSLGSNLQAADPPKKAPEFSDEAVAEAIQKGVQYLLSKQDAQSTWGPYGKEAYPTGPTAIAAYALLASGMSAQDPRLDKALNYLANTPTDKTYCLGLNCQAFALAAKQNDKWLEPLRRDVEKLIKSTKDGSYGYNSQADGKSAGDNSNSQYGLLGVWGGAMADMEIPRDYWWQVMKHWLATQNGDGGWGYIRGRGTSPTMAAAGVASLYVCFDNLFAEGFRKCNVAAEFDPIDTGLNWFHKNYAASAERINLYYLYGVERVALASGFKYFGSTDWYKTGATLLLKSQQPNGCWPQQYGDVVGTSFALLFLVRGQHPVLFNKLEFKGDWNNRPRDMASLTRWISRTFETTVNWQVINLQAPVREWHDAPILYISGSKAPQFTDEDLDKLRQYVWQGGTILSVTECHGGEFRKSMRDVYKKLFPTYPLTEVDPKDDLYQIYFKKFPARMNLWTISNGIRPLVIHTDDDLSLDWQLQRMAMAKPSFDIAANIFMYVTDKQLRSRGVSLWPEAPAAKPARTVKIARIRHEGNCDPEPLAYERFARMLLKETQTGLEVVGPIEIGKLADSGAKLATLTGTGAFALSSSDKEALKKFVESGGTLLIDPAGGAACGGAAFDKSARKLLADLYGLDRLRPLAMLSPLFQRKGLEIERVWYRPITRKKLSNAKTANLQAVVSADGRMGVLYSSEDLTAGLVGYPAASLDGYDPGSSQQPNSAYQILRNIVLMVADETSKPPPAATQTASADK